MENILKELERERQYHYTNAIKIARIMSQYNNALAEFDKEGKFSQSPIHFFEVTPYSMGWGVAHPSYICVYCIVRGN